MRATVGKVSETQLLAQATTILNERVVRPNSLGSLARVGAALNGEKPSSGTLGSMDELAEDEEEGEDEEQPTEKTAAAKALVLAGGASNSVPRRTLQSGTKQTRKFNIPKLHTSSGSRVVSARRYGLPGSSVRVGGGKPKEMVSFF